MDIKYISGGECTLYYVKGHVDKAEFGEAAELWSDQDPELCSGPFPPKAVYYTWLRTIPCGQHCWCGNNYRYHVVDGTPGKQGAFPATITGSWRRNYARGCDAWMFDYTVYPRMPDFVGATV